MTGDQSQSERSACVYVVDDNPQNRELIGDFLDDLGCDVRLIGSGAEAIDLVDEVVPDLVILDVMMPRLSGYQVCERLRADDRTRGVPVIMLTALNETADVERAIEAGADDFLIKPVQRQELVARVEAQLAVRACAARVESAVSRLRQVIGVG